MRLIYYGDTLEHHGILGQKWGVRRYQPYPQGHTGGKEISKAARVKQKAATIGMAGVMLDSQRKFGKKNTRNKPDKNKAYFERIVKQGKDKPAISPAEKIANDTNKATQEAISAANRILNAAESRKPRTNRAATLSDDELRKRINRLQMERTYNSLTTEEKSLGYEKAMLALSVIGSVTGIAATATGILSTVKTLK